MSTLELPGASLYYEVSGSGVPVVLIHGLALDCRMWDDQIPVLRQAATVIRYDVRGFGRSSRADDVPYTHWDDLWRLLDELGVQAAVLVGLSMGGGIALKATIDAPSRVLALVLLDAVVDGVPWDDASVAGMRAIAEGLRSDGLTGAKAAWLRHDFFGPAGRSPELSARLAAMVEDYSGAAWTRPDPHGPGPNVLRSLSEIAVPTTVVVGELDVPCFRTMADVLASTIPGAQLIVVPNAGHMVNMEAPAAVNAILVQAAKLTERR